MTDEASKKKKGVDFYARVIEDGEEMYEAAEIEGVDAEVTLLRLELQRYAKEAGHKLDVLQRSVGQLVRAVVATHRMSPQRADELERAMLDVLKRVGGEIEAQQEVEESV